MAKDQEQSLFYALKVATSGIIRATKEEKNIKIQLAILIVVIILGIILRITRIEWLIIILISSVVLAAEIMNSAIEITCSYIDKEHNLKYGETRLARDIAAGAVWLLAIASMVIGLLIFYPYLFNQ